MTEHQFEQLLLQSESATLDFKRQQYNFSNDTDKKKTAEFIKDIICFSNTIRSEKAYIIIGVGIKADGEKELIGLNEHVDDSVLQEKVKNKVLPIPIFSHETIKYKEKIFGIIEIPIRKYEQPISPIVKLKGLEPGKFYFRRGSSNSEANGLESVSIFNWLKSLPEETKRADFLELITNAISKVIQPNIKLSECISEALKLSNKENIVNLKSFCQGELAGWSNLQLTGEEINTSFSYRKNEVVVTFGEVEVPPYLDWDSRRMINELKKMEETSVGQFFFGQSIMELEGILEKLSESNKMLYSIQLPARNFIDEEKYEGLKVRVYANKDNFENIYNNIRQKLIDELFQASK